MLRLSEQEKQEIIRVQDPETGEVEEQWTGEYTMIRPHQDGDAR